jgi:formylmethanofuran dehydrogenase subunit E
MNMRVIDPEKISLKQMIEEGTKFHGHLGPFLVLGIRMGLASLKELGSTGYSNIQAEAKAGSTPPMSCLVDGIQISTGCTLGKGNITSLPMGKAEATFTFNGRSVTYRVNDEILEQIRNLAHDDLEDFSWKLSQEADEALMKRM